MDLLGLLAHVGIGAPVQPNTAQEQRDGPQPCVAECETEQHQAKTRPNPELAEIIDDLEKTLADKAEEDPETPPSVTPAANTSNNSILIDGPLTSNVKIDADESKVAGVGMHITLDGTGNATAQSSAMLEGAEAMINKLMKRLEDHQLTADLHGKTVSRGSPDRALRMMRKPLSFTNDSSRFHELVHTTRGAARQIFEDTFMLIGDVAIISHDLELIASNDLSHCVERLEDLPAGRPSNSIHSGEMAAMKHKIVLIQNLEKVREELAKTRHDKDLLEQRVQQAEALLRDSRGDCSRKEKEWRADQRELLGQIRDLEAEVAVMRGVGGYIRKQSTSSERIRSQHQDEVETLERKHSQQLAQLRQQIEALEQEVVIAAAARMAAEELVKTSCDELSCLQRRLAEFEPEAPDNKSPAQYPPPPPPLPANDIALSFPASAVKRKEKLSVRADDDHAGWGLRTEQAAPLVYSRPHRHARQAVNSNPKQVDEQEEDDPYGSESRDEAWERMYEEVRQASETTIMMAVGSSNGASSTGLGRRSSVSEHAHGSIQENRERQYGAGLFIGQGDLERIQALILLLQRRVSLERDFIFNSNGNHAKNDCENWTENIDIMQQSCLSWLGELNTLLQVASVEFADLDVRDDAGSTAIDDVEEMEKHALESEGHHVRLSGPDATAQGAASVVTASV